MNTSQINTAPPKAPRQQIDPRDLFIKLNPIGANETELEMGCSGFVDDRTHADYLIFLAGYSAANPDQTEQAADISVACGVRSLIGSLVSSGVMRVNKARQLLGGLPALKNVSPGYGSLPTGALNIDDHVRLVTNAKRYEWLRDRSRVSDPEDTVVAGRGLLYLYGQDLDKEIDDAIRLRELQS